MIIKKTILVIFVFSTLLFSQTVLNNKYRLGKTFEDSGQLERAKQIYEELYSIKPNNMEYVNSLNDVYLKLKEYDKSILLLESTIKKRPNDVNLYGLFGATYFISGNTEKAIEAWDKGVSVNNNSPINYTIISNYAIQNRAFEIAINYLKEGKKKSSNPIQFSYQLAHVYAYTMDYKKAAEEYASVLIVQPNQLEYIKRRMETYLSAVGAKEESIKALEKQRDNDLIKEVLSFLYIRNNQYDKAFELEIELDKLKNDEGVRIYNFANTAYQKGEYDIASKAYSLFVENYPESKFVPNSKIKFARTLEAKLDKEWIATHNNWKPLSVVDTSGAYKYYPIIKTYESLLNIIRGELSNEALYRIGIICFYRFNDLETATEYFEKVLKNASLSKYYGRANLQLAKISIIKNQIDKANNYLQNLFSSSRSEKEIKDNAKFLIAKIEFYKSNFEGSLSTLSNINKDLANDLSNDAIELSTIINMGKRDSVNLAKFAIADLHTYQYKFTDAEKEFKELSENKKLFFLNNISRFKYAEILIALNNYPIAIEVLKELSEKKELNIFADKSFYLLAQVYEFGIADEVSAISTYEKFLELFPSSLYLEQAQKNLKRLKNKKK